MTTTSQTVASLAGLPAMARTRLEDLAVTAEYGAGEVILREGMPIPFLGVVELGRVALQLHVPGRGRVTIVTIEPDELLGWSAVVPPHRATSEAVALEPTRILGWDAPALRERLAADRELAAETLPVILACVSDRLTTSWQQLLDLFGTTPVDPW
jgi:CRP/FNR family transcriptional regulator, cyclic AMP receptor protein